MIELRDYEILGERDFRIVISELKISSGQFIQIYGSNNCGKSLFLKTFAGIYTKTKGELYYNGVSEKAGNYSYILIDEFLAILPDQSVNKNVYLPLGRITKRKQEILKGFLGEAGLKRKLSEKAAHLSRSEKKSLELIRAIIQQPQFILFDDFDTFFDNSSLSNLTNAFEYAAKAGTTIIITAKKKFEGIPNSYIISSGELAKL